MVTEQNHPSVWGRVLYGSLFILVLPLILVIWAYGLDRSIKWPVPDLPLLAAGLIIVGVGAMVKGMVDLFKYGHGLPMNAFPPEKLVTQGIYAWLAHPIYAGAGLISAGAGLWYQSSSGLYIISPILALMALSLWFGYERITMVKRFGDSLKQYHPILSLPVAREEEPSWTKKFALLLLIFVPWVTTTLLITYVKCIYGCDGILNPSFFSMPQNFWFGIVWQLPFLYIVIRLVRARSLAVLRFAAIMGVVAIAIGIFLLLALPVFDPEFLYPGTSLFLTSAAAVFLAANYRIIWMWLLKLSEWVANSRRDWLLADGRFRVINHALYSFFAGAVAVGIAAYVLGNLSAVIVLIVSALVGAGLIAQLWWGSDVLLRPFGYWGGLVGVAFGALLVYFLFGIPFAQVALSLVLCAPFAQAIGRLRCLSQGCCHGLQTNEKMLAIRVWQPQSRVVVHSRLEGERILNTQLFSILFNLILGSLLWGMWQTGQISSWIIVGLYFVFTGIERFSEDAYRGETQTRELGPMRENQWVAIAAVAVGISITLLPVTPPLLAVGEINVISLAAAIGAGLFTAFALSMDFPKSTRRLSRLSG